MQTYRQIENGTKVYVKDAGYGVVVDIEPSYLGWPERYRVELLDGETVWRARNELDIEA